MGSSAFCEYSLCGFTIETTVGQQDSKWRKYEHRAEDGEDKLVLVGIFDLDNA
jgi:hypothetical protein